MDRSALVRVLRGYPPVAYVTTSDELGFLRFAEEMTEKGRKFYIFHSERGLVEAKHYMQVATKLKSVAAEPTHFRKFFTLLPGIEPNAYFYVVLDADRWLVDPDVQRLLRDHVQRAEQDITHVQPLLFLGTEGSVPTAIQDIVQVIPDRFTMTLEDVQAYLQKIEKDIGITAFKIEEGSAKVLFGLSRSQINTVIAQCILDEKKTVSGNGRIPIDLVAFHRNRLYPVASTSESVLH